MNTIKKSILLCLAFSMIICGKTTAQNAERTANALPLHPMFLHVFDADSLQGFNETAARYQAIQANLVGNELKTKLYLDKRNYINDKYHLQSAQPLSTSSQYAARPAAQPGCTNEDFEASTVGAINNSTQINGWTVNSGAVPSGGNNCNLPAAGNPADGKSVLVDCTGGYTDPEIGASYKIYSVFGSGAPVAPAAAANPQISGGMFGNKVLRLNDNVTNDYSMQKLSKTFAVNPDNVVFRFAFISVLAPNHTCCQAGGLIIKLSVDGTPIACPSYSIWAPGIECLSGDAQNITYYVGGTSTPYNPAGSSSPNSIYNKWKINAIDLSPYIGQNVTIDVIAYDCYLAGHFGYVYFDAQCGPMTILGNGIEYPATLVSTPSVATCGASGATVCAIEGMGPYTWEGPGLAPSYQFTSMANQCLITNLSATYTLSMYPQGSCEAIKRVVNTTITPAPSIIPSVVQASCGGTITTVSLQLGGSVQSSTDHTLTWYPAPLTLNTPSTVATYTAPPPLASPMPVSVSVVDNAGCRVSVSVTANPTIPGTTFTIYPTAGTSTLTCSNPSVPLMALTNYTYGTVDWHWVGPLMNSTDVNIEATAPGILTVTAVDMQYSICPVTHTWQVFQNTTSPMISQLTNTIQTVTCTNTLILPVTAVASSTVTSPLHVFTSVSSGAVVSINTHTATFTPGPGDYDYDLINTVTGCSTHATFSITASSDMPTFQVTSTETLSNGGGFTVGCSNYSLTVINIVNANVGGAAVQSFGFIPPGQLASITNTAISSITTGTPGTWVVLATANGSCTTRVPVSIIQNTLGPQAFVNVPAPVLSCAVPSVELTGSSANSGVSYEWLTQSLTFPQQSYTVEAVTSNTANTVVGDFILRVTDNNNGCISTTTVHALQNLFTPKANISVTGNMLTCNIPTLQLTNSGVTSIPNNVGFINTGPIQSILWQGPVPQLPAELQSSYIAATPGVYSMTVRDSNNGCIAQGTVNIQDGKIYPVVNNPQPAPFMLDCGATSTTIYPSMTSTNTSFAYNWITPPDNIFTGPTDTKTVIVSALGRYHLEVTDLGNGCKTRELYLDVTNGSLDGKFTADNTTGFAPLTVAFTNSSTSSLGSSSITSVWNFGNGTVETNTAVIPTQATYSQPGTYTVILYTAKGTCQDADSVVIHVDIPSVLEVPNVFTPNGDGVNDLFFLKAANLTEIEATIYDRWGRVVYKLTSGTGNVAWDGQNAFGKEAAEGVYFYVIKGKGKDGKDHDMKGTINLYR